MFLRFGCAEPASFVREGKVRDGAGESPGDLQGLLHAPRAPWTSLHVERKGMTKVLNVKADPEEIQRLIDHDRYFPAYHMDKVHWISILLDKETDMDAAKRMLDESYALVEKSGRKGRRKVKK